MVLAYESALLLVYIYYSELLKLKVHWGTARQMYFIGAA